MARPALTSRRAGGAAIVMAMLLAALAAIIAATLLWQQQRWAGEYERRRDQVQAQVLAMAGVQWARQILFDTMRTPVTALGQPWSFRLPPTPIENGSIGGYIVDAQSRINVNNLAQAGDAPKPTQAALQRLFAVIGAPPPLLAAITDWIDADDQVTPGGGAEDGYYQAQSIPGLAANAPVRRMAELLAVRSADAATISRLRNFVEALDAPTTVNVNTAPPEVLMAVLGGLDSEGATALIAARTQAPFTSMSDFRGRLARPQVNVDETLLTVRSDWFLVTIEAQQGDTRARARALLKRASTVGDWPAVIWQTVE